MSRLSPVAILVTPWACGSPSAFSDLHSSGMDAGAMSNADAGGVSHGDAGCASGSPDNAPAPACGAAACGNGVRDVCVSCCPTPGGGGGSPGVSGVDAGCAGGDVACMLQETCDGADLGGGTCTSLGFSGGSLGCTTSCSFDTNGCTTCLSDPHTVACLRAPVAAETPSSLALATTDQDIVIAWVAGPAEGGDGPGVPGVARVARFAADLTLVAEHDCIGPSDAQSVAIARSSTGYIAAIAGDGDVVVQPLDASGAPRGSPRVVPNATFPMLAASEQGGTVSGGPLLAWSVWPPTSGSGLEMRATLLDDTGNDAIAPVTLFPTTVQQPRGNYNAVFTGDGFLVVAEGAGLLVKMGLDGTLTRPSVPTGLGTAEYGRLAWTGTEGRLVYLDLGQAAAGPITSRWVRVDSTGAILGAPVTLGGSIYLAPPLATVGQDTLIVYGTDNNNIVDHDSQLSVARVSSTGAAVAAPIGVVKDPEGLYQPRMALRGPDVVLAWVGGGYPGRIGLARIAP